MKPEGSLLCSEDTPPHWSLSWTRWIHPTHSHLVSLGSILILSAQLHLSLLSYIFPLGFVTKSLYTFLTSSMHAIYPANLNPLDLVTIIVFCEAYKLRSSSFCSLLKPSATSSILGPNIPQCPVLKHPQSIFFPWCERTNPIPIQNR